jgi:hypothetical protein
MTLQDTADRINHLFRTYGLTHDVVQVQSLTTLGGIKLDERENEPDPNKWRAVARVSPVQQALAFIDGDDEAAMSLLLTSLEYIFQTYFSVEPPTGQLRLF